ncbi:Alpha-N-acetylglucosaminidase [Arcticibacter svalbardensis MN12-7]|uniref:Alpha-N-acetylglucosaminidase n=1 Tax=Arcticibacter svalbardensis MN12-7 TaxID=1150600 RepID=R9GZ57_9SPHI|nr:alpha-N-acetylglucosaminidase TIM-barrel domain-containing protein [Arcticibacter svalbardensis]EOR96775.1 Alpha-N-acetylglucosaminidase [Arcticibacter svalbardensis MN12-7]
MQPFKCYLIVFFVSFIGKVNAQDRKQNSSIIEASRAVIERNFGSRIAAAIHLEILTNTTRSNPVYETINDRLFIRGNTAISITKGFYDYLKETNQGMVTWSGKNAHIQSPWIAAKKKKVVSPYQYHYYFNVVIHGYTTPYWDFSRWQQELDWMALHGMDMPLINGAYEAILIRVFKKLGLSEAAIDGFFTGPAYHPWNRMGNITGWDNHVPSSYYEKQVKLTHLVMARMNELEMHPIIPAFAGFVPKEITEVFPQAKIKEIIWGGFKDLKPNLGHILLPNNELFTRIGKMYIQEWEKEFGKGKYYLADSFNEMDVPEASNEKQQLEQLSDYGSVVYKSIMAANADAVWVMQGWTFPFHKGADGKLFWTEKRLGMLVEKVPDDKILFLDLANEYNRDSWKIAPSWKTYHGFFNKAWIYSFIPNMGGKTPWNGILKTYAEAPAEALQYKNKGNLIGFGFAPEGIENNEILYELLTDVGWREQKIDINVWISNYCKQRYGAYPKAMQDAYNCFLASCYGTFDPHPRFRYQISATGQQDGSVNVSDAFFTGVKQFLSCANQMSGSELYKNDAIELTSQFLSLKADSLIKTAVSDKKNIQDTELNKAFNLLIIADRLLLSHPNHKLEVWINLAKAWGDTPQERKYYASDAKRLITTWGGTIDDYSARMWAGLISDYYVERMKYQYQKQPNKKKLTIPEWEEKWINEDFKQTKRPFDHPLKVARQEVAKF